MRCRERRELLAWCLAALLFAGGSPAAHATSTGAPFADMVGVNTHLGGSRDALDPSVLQRLADAGVRFIRNDLTWSAVEQTVGVYDFAAMGYDDLVAAAEATALAGCTYYQTVPVAPSGPSSFERAWSAALGAADDVGVSVYSADRTSGVIRGTTAAEGASGSDAVLADRLSSAYDRRMGR